MTALFKIRDGKPEDIPFVMNSFLKKFRESIPIRLVTDRVYYENQHYVITQIMQAPGAKLAVACDPEDENHVYGYVLSEELTPDWVLLHFCYVKGAFRKFGIGKTLITTAIAQASKIQYTHRLNSIKYLNKQNNWEFNPFYTWAMAKPEKR